MSSMPLESPAEGEDSKEASGLLDLRISPTVGLSDQLTLKGVDVLAPPLLEGDVQFFPPHALNSQIGKAAEPEGQTRVRGSPTLAGDFQKKAGVHLWRRLL